MDVWIIWIHQPFLALVEHVAEWLRCWTQDLGVWVAILAALVTCKNFEQALNRHRRCQPNSNGYQVDENRFCVHGPGYKCVAFSTGI